MENNEISMFMDVKLDINEMKTEASKFKSWTKCLVKIEAIRCFPCYIRITLIKDIQDECANFCIRIQIPGLTVRSAKSRTKQFSYGIFWEESRKRCCIFFALDTSTTYERHMKWMKKTIENLELHHQELIETRRKSRYINKENGNHKINLQDILGPLPKIPDISESNNWSRRISELSGIYEEILDVEEQTKQNSKKASRSSVASGIYEEMKPVQNSDFDTLCENERSSEAKQTRSFSRKRINTFENYNQTIPRCYTSPEVEMVKRRSSVSENKVSTKDDLLNITPETKLKNCNSNSAPKTRQKNKHFYGNNSSIGKNMFDKIKTCNKRNSFSSPDLMNINYLDEFEDFLGVDSLSSDYGDSSSSVHNVIKTEEKRKKEHIKNNDETQLQIQQIEENKISDNDENNTSSVSALNISEQIQPNFNFSCNSSTINLVGANLNQDSISIAGKLIDDTSGYCIMRPIIKNNQQQYQNKCINTDSLNNATNDDNDDNKENNEKFATIRNFMKYSIDNAIYETMNPIAELPPLQNKDENNVNIENENKQHQHIYQNLITTNEILNESNKEIYSSSKNKTELTENKSDSIIDNEKIKIPIARRSINFDEKIPSYYPNNCDIGKYFRRSVSSNSDDSGNKNFIKRQCFKNHNNGNNTTTIAVTTATTTLSLSSPIINISPTPLRACKITKDIYKVTKLPENSLIIKDAIQNIKQNQHNRHRHNCHRYTNDNNFKTIDLSKSSLSLNKTNLIKNSNGNHQNHGHHINKISYNKKYATLARLSPQKYFEKSSIIKKSNDTTPNHQTTVTTPTNTNHTDLGNLKKFASLPRLKKIDFSNLKLKINAVLQRHHSDGL